MSGNVRLQEVQAALTQQGAVDVKFCFRPGSLSTIQSSKVADSVAAFLNVYLEKSYTQVERIGAPQVA
jgi:hypothetical protein